MERDDAIQAVAGIEWSALEDLGIGRLDADSQIDHGVDRWVTRHQIEQRRNRLA